MSTLGLTSWALPAMYWVAAAMGSKPEQDDDHGDH
jgi:hypothetical protein